LAEDDEYLDDEYFVWNNHSLAYNITSNDGGTPFGVFWWNSTDSSYTNRTWAVLASSRGRYSYTAGYDPWYMTNNTSNPDFPYQVQHSRPALSCWETTVFELNGRTANIKGLSSLHPALNLSYSVNAPTAGSSFITAAFQAWLVDVMPTKIGVSLGRISLASSVYGIQSEFDAESSSIFRDMQRLVYASYFATKNMFIETTLYSTDGRNETLNLALGTDGAYLAHVGAFVIPSTDVFALSLLVLIIVPVVLAFHLCTLLLLKRLSAPWRVNDALNGTILYSYLDQYTNGENATADNWKREDSLAYAFTDEPARMRPTWKDGKSGPAWIRIKEDGTQAEEEAEGRPPAFLFHGPNKVE
jgi:hypothetical protein